MDKVITHQDGTIYHVERRSSGKWADLFFVYALIKGRTSEFYSRVYATNEQIAVEKARIHYAQSLDLI
jgi:hypothetical protein